MLTRNCPGLAGMDPVRLTLDLDSFVEKVARLVDTILGRSSPGSSGGSAAG
jgi:hypothetical protein